MCTKIKDKKLYAIFTIFSQHIASWSSQNKSYHYFAIFTLQIVAALHCLDPTDSSDLSWGALKSVQYWVERSHRYLCTSPCPFSIIRKASFMLSVCLSTIFSSSKTAMSHSTFFQFQHEVFKHFSSFCYSAGQTNPLVLRQLCVLNQSKVHSFFCLGRLPTQDPHHFHFLATRNEHALSDKALKRVEYSKNVGILQEGSILSPNGAVVLKSAILQHILSNALLACRLHLLIRPTPRHMLTFLLFYNCVCVFAVSANFFHYTTQQPFYLAGASSISLCAVIDTCSISFPHSFPISLSTGPRPLHAVSNKDIFPLFLMPHSFFTRAAFPF